MDSKAGTGFSSKRLTQAALLEQGHDLFGKPFHAVVEIEPGQQYAVDAELAERRDLIGDVDCGAHHWVASRGYLQSRKMRRFIFEAARFLGNSGSPGIH